MKAIIMAGGEGMRLRPLTLSVPKPLIPVRGRPCIACTLDMLRRAGIGEAALTLGYRAYDIIRELGSDWNGMKLTYFIEKEPLGTAGSVRACASFLAGEDSFVVASGDSFCDLDLAPAIEFHNLKRAEATVLLARTDDVLEYGVVVTADDGRVLRFIEKPDWGQAYSDTVNTGTYIFSTRVLGDIPQGRSYDFGRELFPALEARGAPVYGYEAQGCWYDIGDPASLLSCSLDGERSGCVSPDCVSEPGALILDSVIMRGCVIGRGAIVERSVVAPGSHIPAGSVVREAVWYNGREYPIAGGDGAYAFGLGLARAAGGGRVGVGGPARAEVIRGFCDAGANARDLGDADARLCAFAAREYDLRCAVHAGREYSVFDRNGISASRKFVRSVSGGAKAPSPGTVTTLGGLKTRYVSALARSIDRIDKLRFFTTDTLVRSALEKQGGIFDTRSDLIITAAGLSGLDLWHLCAVIMSDGVRGDICLPYVAPAALFGLARQLGVRVHGYALSPFDDSEDEVRAIVRAEPWLADVYFAAAKVLEIISSTGRSLEGLMRGLPSFATVQRDIDAGKSARLAVMKSFGAQDGEGVVRRYPSGRVRAVAGRSGVRLIAEAFSAEAANELLGLSSADIKKLIK